MSNAKISNLTNLESICVGLGFNERDIFFIVDIGYQMSFDAECDFKISKFIGTKQQCERNLIDYPGCKII